nr:ATP-binding cassette domain-containing protein [Dictyobacter formicarum]
MSFVARRGEFTCIIGRSGAGKSTLLRCINGLIPSTQGSIRIRGQILPVWVRMKSLPCAERLALFSRSLTWLTASLL